ncbi:MAG TPA: MFS transporter [Bacteroidota bacterium]|nr:MFS transporter [Bacteroidota bacterium]
MSFVSYNTILPVFIQQVGGGIIAIGSVPVLWLLGLNLPQAMIVRLTHAPGAIKPSVLRFGILHRTSFLVVGFFTLFFVKHIPSTLSVPILLGMIFLTAVSGSFGIPPWFQLFAKTTPMKLRGRLQAVRQLLGSALGMVGGSIVAVVLAVVPFPVNFASLFITAYGLTMISYLFLKSLTEPVSEAPAPPSEVRESMIHQGMGILRKDKNFRNFLLADSFTLMAMSASAFYAVYAIEKFGLSPSFAGTFTVIVMAALAAGNFVFGYLADSFGHKVNLMILAASSAMASAVAMTAGNILIYGLTFVFMAWTTGLQVISRLSFVAELCSEADRPTYVALTNTVTAPTIAVGILFGWIARAFGFEAMFSAAILCGVCGVLWYHFCVTDPRHAMESSPLGSG